jgi:uncharacterized protein (DUF4213/DUF364 family)
MVRSAIAFEFKRGRSDAACHGKIEIPFPGSQEADLQRMRLPRIDTYTEGIQCDDQKLLEPGGLMTILTEILNSLSGDAPVRSILVGAHWTVVCSRHCGMASTLMGNHTHGQGQVRDVGRLHTKTARELAEYVRSENPLEASIGMAATNSLLDLDEGRSASINAVDVLVERGRGKKVALVGHFPFIPKLRPVAGQLWVIEQHPVEDDYPAEAAADLIPQADVVAITSSALVNRTFDGLLALCRPEALVMALGPSTPLSPVLFEHGISILSGIRVEDETAVLQTVSQGATFQQVDGVRLSTLIKSEDN